MLLGAGAFRYCGRCSSVARPAIIVGRTQPPHPRPPALDAQLGPTARREVQEPVHPMPPLLRTLQPPGSVTPYALVEKMGRTLKGPCRQCSPDGQGGGTATAQPSGVISPGPL